MSGPDLAIRAFLVLLGPFAGDYVATLASAWPRAPRPLVGRSTCSRCGEPIPPGRKIPLISWLAQRGRRRCCGGRIPLTYPIGEAAGLASGLAAALAPSPAAQALTFTLGLTLAYVALVDLRRFSIPLWGLGLLAAELAASMLVEGAWPVALQRLATGAVVALAFEVLRRLVRRGGRPGLGAGDVMLAAVLGALVNWRLAAPMVSLAALAPLLIQLMRRKSGPVPLGFWLSGSVALVLVVQRFLAVAP